MLFCVNDGNVAFTVLNGTALCMKCWKAAGGAEKPLPKNFLGGTSAGNQ